MLSEAIILGQQSWVLESQSVRMAVTHAGAHLAPVFFFRNETSPVQPYHISPWQGEDHRLPEGTPDAVLRGDFFCLPFGRAESKLGMCNHGRTSAGCWSFAGFESDNCIHSFRIVMENALSSATVTRQFFLVEGESVIYDLTSVTGLSGEYTFGHHAVLRTPKRDEALLVSTSRQVYGMTFPGAFASLAHGERQSLAMGAEFASLDSVPSILDDSSRVNCTAFPVRHGFGDLLQVAVAAELHQPAWTVAVNSEEGYLWFSLRDPGVLPSTIFWIENCSRHSFPWNGRNCSVGLEDICSFFDKGSEESNTPNAFSQRGIRTIGSFQLAKTFHIPYAQGVVRVPDGFGYVRSMSCDKRVVSFLGENGMVVTTPVQTGFLFGETLAGNSDQKPG